MNHYLYDFFSEIRGSLLYLMKEIDKVKNILLILNCE